MRGFLVPMLAALAAALALSGAALAQTAFTPPDGDFAAAFPGPPQTIADPARTRDDPGQRRYLFADDPRQYEVTVDEYPASIPPPEPSLDTYRLLLSAHAREAGASLTARAAEISGRPAMEGRFEVQGGGIELIRIVMVGRRIYQIRSAGAAGQDLSSAVSFIDSFMLKLGPNPPR